MNSVRVSSPSVTHIDVYATDQDPKSESFIVLHSFMSFHSLPGIEEKDMFTLHVKGLGLYCFSLSAPLPSYTMIACLMQVTSGNLLMFLPNKSFRTQMIVA